jgi:hypothetical protein
VEKCPEKRADFIETLGNYPQYKLYFINECGLDKYLYREYAYSPKGTPVESKINGKKFKRTNVIAAKYCEKIIAPMIYDGSIDCVLFKYWFGQILL